MFSLESPHHIKKENNPKLSQICSYGIFSKGPKNEFETAVVNEPSVFEPLKFYCNLYIIEIKYVYNKPKGLGVTPEICNGRSCGISSTIKSL